MEYKITCVCGHSFVVSDDKVRGELQCPSCHQRLSPAIQAPATPAAAAPAPSPGTAPSASVAAATTPSAPAADAIGNEPTKRCPFCGEVILAIARKCKHCGEFLDRAPPDAAVSGAAAALAPNAAGTSPTPASASDPVYALATSQWDNFWRYLVLAAIVAFVGLTLFILRQYFYLAVALPGAMVFAGFIGWFFYLRARYTRIRVYPLRIDVETGILSKNLDSLELFRITDTEFKQTFLERILGIGTIKLMTNDSTSEPELILFQIPRAREVYRYLQVQIPLAAKQRGAVYMEK